MKISQPESPEQHGERQPSTDGVERTQARGNISTKHTAPKWAILQYTKYSKHVKYIGLLFNGLHSLLLAKYYYKLVKVGLFCPSII